jgi:ribonuclease HI
MKKYLLTLKDIQKNFSKDKTICDLAKSLSAMLEKQESIPAEIKEESQWEIPSIVVSSNGLALFTDGACTGNPGPGAWAFVLQNAQGQILSEGSDVSSLTTNNKMELSAVIEGLLAAKKVCTTACTLYFYSDSKYVVDGFNQWIEGWKKRGWKKADHQPPENLDLWKQLDALKYDPSFKNVFAHWIKGHAGHPQNEYCDEQCQKSLKSMR